MVMIQGHTYVAGSAPQIAPRFPGVTWPGSHAVPAPPMLRALAINTAANVNEVNSLIGAGQAVNREQFRRRVEGMWPLP